MPVIVGTPRRERPREVVVWMLDAARSALVELAKRLVKEGRGDLIIAVEGLKWVEDGVSHRLLLRPILLPDSRGERVDAEYFLAIEKYLRENKAAIVAWAHIHHFPGGHTWLSRTDLGTLRLMDWADPGVVFLVSDGGENLSAWAYDGVGGAKKVEIRLLSTAPQALYKSGRVEPLAPAERSELDQPVEVRHGQETSLEEVKRACEEAYKALLQSYLKTEAMIYAMERNLKQLETLKRKNSSIRFLR